MAWTGSFSGENCRGGIRLVAQLAIAKDFLAEYARLGKDVQDAVDAAIAKFASHPDPRVYLEKPPYSLDDRIRIMGLGGRWCGVILAPATGDVYYLVRVLPRSKAIAYAASHRFSVNRALGVLEVRDEEAIRRFEAAPQAAAEPAGNRLYVHLSDAELTQLGVDAELLPKIRLLNSEADLEGLQAALPDAQYAALHALACGLSVDEAREEMVRLFANDALPAQVDPDDLVSAMVRTPGQVTFVSGLEELQLVLAHPFAQWRTFLHPSQRKIAYRASYSGPAQVTGGPGTGKTVTVLHRAAFLAAYAVQTPADESSAGRQLFQAELGVHPVLVTSFNGILADALANQLNTLIRDDWVRRQIQVLNVDRLAYAIVKAVRGTPVIADEATLRALWTDTAASANLDLTPAFLKHEWEQVLLAQDLTSEQAYLTCIRAGRGRPLTRSQRGRIWQAAQQVTDVLAATRQSTHLQLANEATHLLRQAGAPPYRHILVDEAQDLHPSQWRLLRAAVTPGPNDLFIAGDPNQRIYNNRISLSNLGISVRGRSSRLSLNYRTTQEILTWAVPLLGTEPVTGLDGEVDSLVGYRSPMRGAPPQLRITATRSEEFRWLAERIRSWLALGIEPQAIAVMARSADLVRETREILKADGIMTTPLTARGSARAVRTGTMHTMKGLEFQAVAVIGVEEGLVPEPTAVTPESEDPIAHSQDLQRERCVLFVACTRARDHLYVSGTGEASPFLPPREPEPESEPEPEPDPPPVVQLAEVKPAVVRPPAVPPDVPRKVSSTELLQLREDEWRPRLRGASLVAEADLRADRTRQAAVALARRYAELPDRRAQGKSLLLRWPACLVAAMAGVAVTDYKGGTYWPALWEAARFPGTTQDQTVWGNAFNAAVARLGMPTFSELPLTYVGPILMHAGIPAYCLGDYFRLLLNRRRLNPGMDAESFLAWATEPGRGTRLAQIDKPAQRFLLNGGDFAQDVVERTLDLLELLTETDPDFDVVRLPGYMVEAAKAEQAAGRLDLSGAGHNQTGTGTVKRQVQPRIALDPYGQGVHVLLPAVGDTPDGVARWRITADGETRTVQSRAVWVGAAETTPQTVFPLDRPVRTVLVALAGHEELAHELRVVDQSDPVLFFGEDGRRLAGTVSLPRSRVWIMHPADTELKSEPAANDIVKPSVPFGWEGWQLRLVSLENVQAVGLQGRRMHQVDAHSRPRLLLDEPLPGVTTPFGSPVYPVPPRLHLPPDPGTDIRWHAEIRRVGEPVPLVSRAVGQPDEVDIWAEIPHPVLGAFEVTVRGPLGRGLRRTVFVAEGLSVAYQPQVRLLTGGGLATGTARLTAGEDAAAKPDTVGFGPAEPSHLVEYRTDTETEPLVITPPHAAVLCPGAVVTSWSTALLQLVAEDFSGAGRLLVRVPQLQGRPELVVSVRGQQLQAIEPSGPQSPGLAGFELGRANDTIAVHRHAELALRAGRTLMPVGYVRPRRLASGVELSGDTLVLRDFAAVDGLTAGVYLVHAPWRAPALLPVAADGTAVLPAELREAGPLLVLPRIDDPWAASEWPRWPRSAYNCPAPGVPVSADEEEHNLSRFVAGEAELLPPTKHLGWLWRLAELALPLGEAGARRDMFGHIAGELLCQRRDALLALTTEELGQAAVVALLIATGIAAAPAESRPWSPDELRILERLWPALPPAAAIAAGNQFDQADVRDAAITQCGETVTTILSGQPDPHAAIGRFGPEAEQMASWAPDNVDALWQAAAIVPKAMLDADTRLAAARRMFDARHEAALRAAAAAAKTIAETTELVIRQSCWPDLAESVAARKPSGRSGWLALPSMSIAMALTARLAARGNRHCAVLERDYRSKWLILARHTPELAAIDLVLAEALVAAASAKNPQPQEN